MPKTLLLADDSPAVHRVVELTFANRPIQVIAVGDGAAAVARIQSAPPDIILADIAMPAPTGYDIAALVKGTPHLARIPVVLLTGAFEPVDEARAKASGCDGVLAKPFDPEIVAERVTALLERKPDEARAGAGQADRTPPAPAQDLDDYFERLDANLTALTAAGPPAPEEPGAGPLPDLDLGAPFGAPRAAFDVAQAIPSGGRGADLPPIAPPEGILPPRAIADAVAALVDPDEVRDIVSQVAERIIREEIARIKQQIGEQ